MDADHLRLTDFLDLPTLQEIQDSFAAVANVKATITDAQGLLITQPTPTREFIRRQNAIADAEERQDGPTREGREYVAPIMIGQQRLGTIRMSSNGTTGGLDEAKLKQFSERFAIDGRQLKALITQMSRARNTRPAAIQFLFLLANAIARLCFQEYQLRQRINELTAVYNVTMMLADARDLQKVLARTVKVVCDVMETKAASIRMVDAAKDELVISATHNLSPTYQNKGPVNLSTAAVDRVALGPQGHEYVANMATDPRVRYPHESEQEGIVSMLSAGMRYKGKSIGVLRVYTEKQQTFSQLKIDLLKAVASQAAAAIENARLVTESIEAERLEKQVQTAAEVQMRMIPQNPPVVPGLDLSCVYVPCFELGGDFYDVVSLPYDNVGLIVADVSGKGVPASLIMASVRAAMRAEIENVFYLYEVVRRLNVMLCRDTKASEFVTLFYGVIDVPNHRLTYCSAGHPPALLRRNGVITELPGQNLVLGVEPDEIYRQETVSLEKDDAILLYTDGLTDGMNFKQEIFGKQRMLDAYLNGGATADGIAHHILWELRKHAGMARRNDDVTMVVARMT